MGWQHTRQAHAYGAPTMAYYQTIAAGIICGLLLYTLLFPVPAGFQQQDAVLVGQTATTPARWRRPSSTGRATTQAASPRPRRTPPRPQPLPDKKVATAGTPRETITIYIEPAKTRSTLFLTKRLVAYSRGKYNYRHVVLNARLARNATAFRHETCVLTPGFKVFVGHGELALRNWPGTCETRLLSLPCGA